MCLADSVKFCDGLPGAVLMGFQSFQPKVESLKPLLLRVGEFEDRSFRIAFTARDRASSFGHLKQIRRAYFPTDFIESYYFVLSQTDSVALRFFLNSLSFS